MAETTRSGPGQDSLKTGGILAGKVALVTGAAHSRGIGRAILEALQAEGANALGVDLHGAEGLDDIGGQGCDVTDPSQATSVVEQVMERYGQFDILVNNAGVGVGSPSFMEITDQDWELSLNVNLRGIVNMCRAVIPAMRGRGGSIINIASLAGLGALESIPACYTASKFAAVGLTRQLALEFSGEGIRCNAVCPGSVVTQMHEKVLALLAQTQGVTEEEAEALEASRIPLGRSAQPSEVASTVVFLASDFSSYITGAAIPVAGGMSAGL